MHVKLHIPYKPPTYNKAKIPVRGRMIKSPELKRFHKAMKNYIRLNCTSIYKKLNKWVLESERGEYGLRIRYNKHGNSDFSNYVKAIEDGLVIDKKEDKTAGVTPDDRFAKWSPIMISHGAPEVGFIVEIYTDEECQKEYELLKRSKLYDLAIDSVKDNG